MVRELIEKAENKEKPVIERLEELKKKEMERMEEDNVIGAWNNIEPEHLIQENQETYDFLQKSELVLAQEKLKKAIDESKKIKSKDKKKSNEEFIHWINDKINAETARRELEEERQKDN